MRPVVGGLGLAAAYLSFLALTFEEASIFGRLILFLLPAVLLAGLAKWLERRRRVWLTTFRDTQARELLDRLMADGSWTEPIFLYLRPFASTGNLVIENPRVVTANAALPEAYETAILEAESVLRDALDQFGTLIALGRPGEHYGAGRVAVDDADWRARFDLLVERASLIFLLPSDTPGTLWEVEQLRERGHLGKTILLMPPATKHGGFFAAEEWARARTKLRELRLELPEHQPSGALFPFHGGGLITNWMTKKERKLRRELQDLVTGTGNPLTPRPAAGRRTDAPLWSPLSWFVVFSLMTLNADPGWPSFPSTEVRNAVVAAWLLAAISFALLLFLLVESMYGRLGKRALVVLVVLALYATGPHAFLPEMAFLYSAPLGFQWLILVRGAVVGALLGMLLNEVLPSRFKIAQVILVIVVSVIAGELLAWLGRWITSPLEIGTPRGELLAGFLFGLVLPRAMKWDPLNPRAVARPPLGIEGLVIAWLVLGYALGKMQWAGEGRAWLWIVMGVGGGAAQCFGWRRQGRPLPRSRCAALVAGWGAIAGIVFLLATRMWGWLQPVHEGLIGLLVGAAGGALSVLVQDVAARSRTSMMRQAIFVGAAFGTLGILGRYAWDSSAYVMSGAPPLMLLLAMLMGTAGYLEVR